MISKNAATEKLVSTLMTMSLGSIITFANKNIVPSSERVQPMYITIEVNEVDIDSTLVNTGASVNIFSLSTLQVVKISECEVKPTHITVVAYDNSKKVVHGKVTLEVGIGNLYFPIEFYAIDISSSYNAILGRTWLKYVHGVASMVHHCVKFIHKGQVIKIESTLASLLDEDPNIPTLTLVNPSSPPFIVKHVLSILKLNTS